MKDEYGPSYFDCEELASLIRGMGTCLVALELLPPVVVSTTGNKTSWTIVARLKNVDGSPGPCGIVVRSYGRGGAFKTMPAAIFSALSELHDRVWDRNTEASKGAAF